jgi:hypothetical protein
MSGFSALAGPLPIAIASPAIVINVSLPTARAVPVRPLAEHSPLSDVTNIFFL